MLSSKQTSGLYVKAVSTIGRNKHPEETVKLILDTAIKLFSKKGYEKTSLQDIIDETGLSKGAIYHHFSCKEEIFEEACNLLSHPLLAQLTKIRDDHTMSGQDKLRAILKSSLTNPEQQSIIDLMPNMLENPKFLAIQIRETIEINAPQFIEPIIRQGIEDGSLSAAYPQETAQALLLLANIWLNPLIFSLDAEAVKRKIEVMDLMFKSIGLDFIDDELKKMCIDFCSI